MSLKRILLAVEDQLSEEVGRRLLGERKLELMQVMGLRGNGFLKKRVVELNRSAKSIPVFLLTDQDNPQKCPATLIKEWLPQDRNEWLLFRVVVVEIESWLLADRFEFARFMGVSASRVPENPEQISDPKEALVALARVSKDRRIRTQIAPLEGGTAKVGPQYNAFLSEFVRNKWSPARASKNSQSLRRTILALDERL